MLNPLFFLISRLNIACSPLIFNLQINYPIRIKDIPFLSFQLRTNNLAKIDADIKVIVWHFFRFKPWERNYKTYNFSNIWKGNESVIISELPFIRGIRAIRAIRVLIWKFSHLEKPKPPTKDKYTPGQNLKSGPARPSLTGLSGMSNLQRNPLYHCLIKCTLARSVRSVHYTVTSSLPALNIQLYK